MISSLAAWLSARGSGICLYGLAPPKQATPAAQLERIVAQHLVRLGSLQIDGVVVYDIQDEAERISTTRRSHFCRQLTLTFTLMSILGLSRCRKSSIAV
jgi:hypothetical protein